MIQKHIVEFFGVFRCAMRQKKGFTLIELLVVIAILGLLAAVVVINLNPAANLAQTRDARRIADLSALKDAMELYAFNTGAYPASIDAMSDLSVLIPNYLAAVPADPTNSGTNIYSACSTASGDGFAIGTKFETTKYANTAGTTLPCDPDGAGAAFTGALCPVTASNYYCTSGKKS